VLVLPEETISPEPAPAAPERSVPPPGAGVPAGPGQAGGQGGR
jgi:hypothetical protein